jgi:hypothetical protein
MSSVQRSRHGLRIFLTALGAACSLLLVTSVYFRIRLVGAGPLLTPRFAFREFVHELPGHLPYLVAFTVLSAMMTPLRAIQWQRTLREQVPFWERFHLVAIGAFAHNLLPGKMGDVTRAFLLARKRRIPFVETLGSVVLGKLLELVVLILLTALVLLGPMSDAMAPFARGLRISAWVGASLVILVLILARSSERLSARLERRHRWPRVQSFLRNASAGLGTLRTFRPLMAALAWSAAPVLASALGYGIWLEGLGVRGGLVAGVLMTGAITLGQSTLGLAAATGTSFAVAAWAASTLGAGPLDAAAFSTLSTFATVLSQVVPGAVSLATGKVGWPELTQGREGEPRARVEEQPAS